MLRAIVAVCLAYLCLGEAAWAGAWLQRKGEGVFISSLSSHVFEGEGPRLQKLESAFYLEYGLHEHVTAVARWAVEEHQQVTLISERTPIGWVDRQTLTVQTRLSDLELAVRFPVFKRTSWVVSGQLTGMLSVEDRLAWTPDRSGLGDGYEGRLLVGRSLGQNAFAEGQIALRHWPGAALTETRFDTTMGWRVYRGVEVMAQTYSTWGAANTLMQGRPYSAHRIQVSVQAPLLGFHRVQLSALDTVHRDGLPREQAYMVSIWRRF